MREAVVLASGAGKRLRSVTGDVPKVFYRFDGCELVKYPMISLMKTVLKDSFLSSQRAIEISERRF